MEDQRPEINFLKTRSFWATLLAIMSAMNQATGDQIYGVLDVLGGVLLSLGWIDDPVALSQAFGPLLVAILGTWAYLERIFGKKDVVFHKVAK